ncbi:sigma-70 family RNA polymerase sigma factor [Microbacterium oxydans]|uniref:sigma-70 family RNA polymerase sigma factor n=1 Tax=Microbacterium oxydans TaxID=82380 RepID=UPI00366B0E11
MTDDHTAIAHERDVELLARTRAGDSRAYAELWQRYAPTARAVARTYWWSADSDDLVAESFTRIYQAIQSGKGPTAAFKPYLYATMRNLAISWARSRREVPIEHIESVEDPRTTESAADADFDASLVSRAILALPSRWQEVLWFAEVENLSMHEIGQRLGLTERAAAVLAFRAREGLRQAWIAAHLSMAPPASKDCHWTLGKLGAHARRRLTERDADRLEVHLSQCGECRARSHEAKQAGSRMLSVLFPGGIAIGAGLSAGGALGSDGASASAAPMPVTVALPAAGLAATSSTFGGVFAVALATLVVGVIASAGSIFSAGLSVPAAEPAAGVVASVPPTASPTPRVVPSATAEPTPVESPPAPTPEGPPAQANPPKPEPPVVVAPPQIAVPPAPVIVDIPTQVSRTEVFSASIRCEAGADITVTVYDLTIAAGVCSSDAAWQASLDVAAFAGPSGSTISIVVAQSNAAGVSDTASAEVVIVD